MRAATFFRAGVAGLCLSLVAACGGDGNFGGSFGENGGFRSRYESARSALEAAGVKFDGPTQEIPEMVKLATFYDPDNNAFMLAQDLA